MSTATPIDRGLYAVPAPPQQERFALLLRLRRVARQALDTVLALPRGAVGWALRRARAVLSALGGNPVLARLATRLASLADLFRSVGPVRAAAAVFSIPAVWRATVRVGRFLGSTIAAGASALWQQTRSLLDKCGPTGARVASGLANTGTAVQRLFVSVVTHPASQTITRGVTSLAGLVRPVSQTVVVHRLLGLLLGASWLRWALQLVALPLVIAPGLVASVVAGAGASRPARSAVQAAERHTAAAVPAVVASTPSADIREPEMFGLPDGFDDWDSAVEPLNRAERRAQQHGQTHAKRTRARH